MSITRLTSAEIVRSKQLIADADASQLLAESRLKNQEKALQQTKDELAELSETRNILRGALLIRVVEVLSHMEEPTTQIDAAIIIGLIDAWPCAVNRSVFFNAYSGYSSNDVDKSINKLLKYHIIERQNNVNLRLLAQ